MHEYAGTFRFIAYEWVLYAHVASVLLLALGQGVTIVVAWRLKEERELVRIQALLDLSRAATRPAWLAFGAMLLTGILLGLLGHWFGQAWLTVTIVLLLAMQVAMDVWGARPLNALRRAAGLEWSDRRKHPAGEPDYASVALARGALRPFALTLVGAGGMLLLLWLMMLKPSFAIAPP